MFEATIQVHNLRTPSFEPEKIIRLRADTISGLLEQVDLYIARNATELSLGKSLTVSYARK